MNLIKAKNIPEKTIMEILKAKSRDNSRTPMQWDDSEYAGFSKVKPWINVCDNYQKINVAKQINDPNSLFNFYKKLINLKKTNAILFDGKIEFIDSNDNLIIFKRFLNNKSLLIVLNLEDKTVKLDLKKHKKNNVLLNNYKLLNYESMLPYQGVILEE